MLRCEMTGSPRPYIYWTLNGAYLTYDLVRREINGTYPDKNRRNIHFSEIHFSPLRRFDDGEFKCFGQNHGGSIEKNYPLEVNCELDFFITSSLVLLSVSFLCFKCTYSQRHPLNDLNDLNDIHRYVTDCLKNLEPVQSFASLTFLQHAI